MVCGLTALEYRRANRHSLLTVIDKEEGSFYGAYQSLKIVQLKLEEADGHHIPVIVHMKVKVWSLKLSVLCLFSFKDL